ncbi:MAG: hypothetical protein IKW86_09865 [Salinivirgaceae bacterium]|nr:hypothetical protein [Salinivirgaceae bacterium]
MTAIVGVLNRQGAAFAADSAATHIKTHKITNHANKIFSISKYHPVGVALYNSLSFMGVPWETIIKSFRQKLNDNTFDTLHGYIDAFWNYLKTDIIVRWPNLQEADLINFANCYYNQIIEEAKADVIGNNTLSFFTALTNKMELYRNAYKDRAKCDDLQTYTEMDVYKYIQATIDNILAPLQQMDGCPNDLQKNFLSSLLSILKADENTYTTYTGLVFWGFGEEEFYPSYYEYNISMAFDGRLKFFLKQSSEMEKSGAAIASFAQTDMDITLMRGIAPDLSNECYNYYLKSLEEFKNELSTQLQSAGAPQALLDIIGSIDVKSKAQQYIDGIEDFIRINHTDKLIEAIGYLSKEDLAEIAENMVSMTYLNRRFTSQEESVGGPVDVAVITKGDGFVWIKRKHYFDASINQQFFERYNR